jgi:hypothetical protein
MARKACCAWLLCADVLLIGLGAATATARVGGGDDSAVWAAYERLIGERHAGRRALMQAGAAAANGPRPAVVGGALAPAGRCARPPPLRAPTAGGGARR